jgi:hypothetical protein
MTTAAQKKKAHKIMAEHKESTLKSGSGKKVDTSKNLVFCAG